MNAQPEQIAIRCEQASEATSSTTAKTLTEDEMPDVAKTALGEHQGTLDWVGMHNIALPIELQDAPKHNQAINTSAQIYVNLTNPELKGIHMSRLYLGLTEFAKATPVSAQSLRDFVKDVLTSHEGISNQARLDLKFDYLIQQPALKSSNTGWKAYPTQIRARVINDQVRLHLGVEVPYSSTCPCSAALARQLLQQAFSDDFKNATDISKDTIEQWLRSEKGSAATPHSQRSAAKIAVALDPTQSDFELFRLIEAVEKTLGTPVQTAVKREDEQEFARLNGENMMFCEDAARRLKSLLNKQSYADFWLKVEHYESLHAHDAVAVATKGLANGFGPELNWI